jgi:Domain of unknown function (DUF4136)
MIKPIAALAAIALTGCASLENVDVAVSSYSRWPTDRGAMTYAFERLPSQQEHPQAAQLLEDAARVAVESAGFKPAAEAATPDVTVQIGARITAVDRSPYDDPFWYGAYGAYGGYWASRPAFGRGRFGPAVWGPGWRTGYWGPGYGLPYYEREVAVLIRDKRTGEPLYEGRAESSGLYSTPNRTLPVLFVAALQDFPAGSGTNPHRVTIEAKR